MTATAEFRQTVIEQSDHCVMCGLCLEHCPTYQLSRNEAESPRGRISLLRALALNELQVDRQFMRHIDQCTGCLRCESECPANVDYSSIIDYGRALQLQSEPLLHRLKKIILLNSLRYHLTSQVSSGLNNTASKLGIANSLPIAPSKTLPTSQLKPVKATKKVTLFTGCTGKALDNATLNAGRELLAKFNIEAVIPNQHLCCGATFQHSGMPQKALSLLRNTVQSIDRINHYPLISIATGCAAQLVKYAPNLSGQESFEHKNILDFIASLQWPNDLKISRLSKRVFLHTPCSAQQTGSNEAATKALLQKIPDMEIISALPHYGCCGAGGVNLFTQIATGEKLAAPLVEQILDSNSELVLTSNIGCQLQLRRALHQRGQKIEVLHPVTLLNRQTSHA